MAAVENTALGVTPTYQVRALELAAS